MSNDDSTERNVADDRLDELIHRGDLDALVRMIDDRCSARDWSGLLRLRDRARHAVETGRQLWPAATLAEYRLALLATPEYVAAVLDESDGLSGRFNPRSPHRGRSPAPQLGRVALGARSGPAGVVRRPRARTAR
jgi:hypothetical protein